MTALPGLAQETGSTPASADTARGEHKLRKITLNLADKDTSLATVTIDLDREMSTKSADHVRFGESIRVREDERIDGDVVSIGGTVVVEGEVTGDAVAVGGRVEIADRAKVAGDVVSVGGDVSIGDSAQVFGDAVSVWGGMDIASTAVVSGEQVQVGGLGFAPKIGFPFGTGRHDTGHELWAFIRRAVWVLVLAGLGFLAFTLFPARMRRLSSTTETRGLVAFLAGFAGLILWLPAFILLCVTIIGIPVALLLIFLTPVAMLLGYIAVAEAAGRRLLRGRSVSAPSLMMTVGAGVLALEGLLLVAKLLRGFGSAFGVLGSILGLIGWSVIAIAATIGFGAFLMTRVRAEREPVVPASASLPPSPTPPPAI
jgi:hypothetical protein